MRETDMWQTTGRLRSGFYGRGWLILLLRLPILDYEFYWHSYDYPDQRSLEWSCKN